MKRDGLKPVDDRKIIERVLKGDTDAFNLLVRQWEKPIYNFIVRMIGDREEFSRPEVASRLVNQFTFRGCCHTVRRAAAGRIDIRS